MILHFPDRETLTLAMTSGAVPAAVSTSPAAFEITTDGKILVMPSTGIPKSFLRSLARLGVHVSQNDQHFPPSQCLCWPQILPLQKEHRPIQPNDQTHVLFELPDSTHLPKLIAENLRLGNDRQRFRFLESDAGTERSLLLVVGPSYYSLLRAIDRDSDLAPRAYLERRPRLWIEIGYTHPLLELIKPPDDSLLLLHAPNRWDVLDDQPFQDIYEILEFSLPNAPVLWHDTKHASRLRVPLRLAPVSKPAVADLWVLREDPIRQMEELVRNSDDDLLRRLTFAAGEIEGHEVAVLRARPSRQGPPVLVVNGVPFRSYLKLPNLYVPCNMRLQPPLRRDAVRKLLAEDGDQLTWLYPHDDGNFTPESLPERSFRPLAEWIDYILTRDQTILQSWVQSTQFDFERFVCNEDDKPRKKVKTKKLTREKTSRRRPDPIAQTAEQQPSAIKQPKETEPTALERLPALVPSELLQRQRDLEQQFLQVDGPLNAPARQALWPELGLIYHAQGNHADAVICFANVLWEGNSSAGQMLRRWQQAQLSDGGAPDLARQLAGVLAEAEPNLEAVRHAAATIVVVAQDEKRSAIIRQHLGQWNAFLQKHEHLLPVRLVWLAARALYELSGKDLLALARTRDRLLERLFQQGLMPEVDLPRFLRFTGSSFNERFRFFREWLGRLPQRVHTWLEKVNTSTNRETGHVSFGRSAPLADTCAYADLILAFGLARLGERDQAQALHNAARQQLGGRGDVHSFLLEAFGYRIQQAMSGTPATGQLPRELLEFLAHMEETSKDKYEHEENRNRLRLDRLRIDRMRQHSRILEPVERIDPYRTFTGRYANELQRALAQLPDIHDHLQLQNRLEALLKQFDKKGQSAVRERSFVLSAVMELGPRLGQAFTVAHLPKVYKALHQLPDALAKAALLDKAILAAAHFDQPEHVEQLVDEFKRLLHSLRDAAVLESLAAQSLRGLRKLGLRDTIFELLGKMMDALLQGLSLEEARQQSNWCRTLQSIMHVAAGNFYFGNEEQGRMFVEDARRVLYHEDLAQQEKKNLACSFAMMLGQAPVELATQCIDEMFQKLHGIGDAFITSTHFSLSQLNVVEAVMLSVISDDFSLGSQARRWLDEDEYIVRKRIHHDMRSAALEATL